MTKTFCDGCGAEGGVWPMREVIRKTPDVSCVTTHGGPPDRVVSMPMITTTRHYCDDCWRVMSEALNDHTSKKESKQ